MNADEIKGMEAMIDRLVELIVAIAKEYGIDQFTYRSMPTPALSDTTPECTLQVAYMGDLVEGEDYWISYGGDDTHGPDEWVQIEQVNFLLVSDAFIRALIKYGRHMAAKRKESIVAGEAALARLHDFRNVDLESKVE